MKRGARSAKSFATTSGLSTSCPTWRLAASVFPLGSAAFTPRLATVMIFSTKGRSSLAFGTVVVMCSWVSRASA